MKRALVLGSGGQLATELARAHWPGVDPPRVLAHGDCDITIAQEVDAAVGSEKWIAVVNAAAYTAVDRAESESATAFAVNRDGPANLARACAEHGVPLVHVSTDYVFDGRKAGRYVEDDPTAPINVYGASKAAGEQAVREICEKHLIVRTSWVYSAHGSNFVKTMIRLAAEREVLKIVADQHGSPTSAADIAEAIIRMVDHIGISQMSNWGTFHFTGAGDTTWFGFASLIMDQLAARGRRVPTLIPISTDEFGAPAQRPANSRLDCSLIGRTFGILAKPWRESAGSVLNELLQGQVRGQK